ncbi:glycosyltransferase family 4 protein [Trichocoleus sp. Lan]|uniref:glycosyltransferase family 4 protein n=1 Tax=Trichocoleus sp. Lan TaxID=2933927 RepID=UPI00329688EC
MRKIKSVLRIAVDMTPILSNGENGGSKVLVLTLFKRLQTLAPNYKFFLLTAPWNHEELIEYENKNTKCILIEQLGNVTNAEEQVLPNKFTRFGAKIVKKIQKEWGNIFPTKTFLKNHKIDLLFCPFSAPNFAEDGIPTVAIVYDLQHLDYPEFFTEDERLRRDQFFSNLLKLAEKIVCISEFSRQSFIQKLNVSAKKLDVVHISIYDRWSGLREETEKQYLQELELKDCNYAFYPANYWPHKNHRMLLKAYQMYHQQFSGQHLDLVFTGALEREEKELREIVAKMNLSDRVHFLGYLNEEALEAVWRGCKCLVFPSLYEGFGIPVLEAMGFGKPVLSSTAGSLPEVCGDAVLYFDPERPEEIAQCLAKITSDTELVNELVSKGYQRLKFFDCDKMAHQYLDIFKAMI